MPSSPTVHTDCGQQPATNVSHYQRIRSFVVALICAISCAYFAVRIAPAGLADAAPSIERGLLPEWAGSREILHRHIPYAQEAAQSTQTELRSGTRANAGRQQFRYAYPVYFAFLFVPLAVLPFQVAQKVALLAGIAVTGVSLRLWLRDNELHNLSFGILAAFAFGSYPVFLALQLRQPTIMIAAILAAAYSCVRSNRLILAGILAGLSLAKPHVAIPVLLPLAIWSMAEWRTRKTFLLAVATTFGALLLAAEIAIPGWISGWITTLETYAHFNGANPLLIDVLPRNLYVPACVLLVAANIWVGLNFRDKDLLFAVAFSVAAFELMLQFQIYNEVLLLPATLWTLDQQSAIRQRGQLQTLVWSLAWILLGAAWISQAALTTADLLIPGSGVALWQVPLAAIWLYPWPLFFTLAAYAITSRTAPVEHSMPWRAQSKSAIPEGWRSNTYL